MRSAKQFIQNSATLPFFTLALGLIIIIPVSVAVSVAAALAVMRDDLLASNAQQTRLLEQARTAATVQPTNTEVQPKAIPIVITVVPSNQAATQPVVYQTQARYEIKNSYDQSYWANTNTNINVHNEVNNEGEGAGEGTALQTDITVDAATDSNTAGTLQQ